MDKPRSGCSATDTPGDGGAGINRVNNRYRRGAKKQDRRVGCTTEKSQPLLVYKGNHTRSHACSRADSSSTPAHDRAGRTTSMEQCARAATAADTLPSRNRSTRL